MRVVLAIAKKELAGFFYSPIAYILLFLISLWGGYAFFINLSALQENVTPLLPALLSPFGDIYFMLLVLFTPAVTMRLLSEEKRSGTLEPLMTAPVSDLAVVMGKFLAAMAFFLVLWLPSLIFLLVVIVQGGRFDPGLAFTLSLGVILPGAMFLAAGLFASSLGGNQIIAASVSLLLNFVIIYGPTQIAKVFPSPGIRQFVDSVQLGAMLAESSDIGVLDSAHLAFFASLAAFFLFLTVRVVELRKWR